MHIHIYTYTHICVRVFMHIVAYHDRRTCQTNSTRQDNKVHTRQMLNQL